MSQEKVLVDCGNDFYEGHFNELCRVLEEGKVAEVYIDCIGHTRNNWAQDSYRKALEEKYGGKLLTRRSDGAYCYSYQYKLV